MAEILPIRRKNYPINNQSKKKLLQSLVNDSCWDPAGFATPSGRPSDDTANTRFPYHSKHCLIKNNNAKNKFDFTALNSIDDVSILENINIRGTTIYNQSITYM